MFEKTYKTFSRKLRHTASSYAAKASRFGREVKGVVAIETAFILPAMVVLYFGLVDVTDLMSANRKVTQTASTLADLVTQAPGTVSKADIDGFFNAAGPIMDPYVTSNVGLEFFGYELKNGAVTLNWSRKQGKSCGGAPSNQSQMKTMMIDSNDLIVARVCYTYQPVTGKVIGTASFDIDDTMMLRPRISNTLRCNDC